jgi:cell division septation protein DedD
MATGLFLTGCLAVLVGTFVLGVIAGRLWPRSPAAPSETTAKASREASARALDRTGRPVEPAPTLTFYHELTAPLATAPLAAPPPAKPPKPARADRADKAEAAPKPERAAPPELAAPGAAAFTVQVAAYKAKEPAEALRARLSAAGLDVYVIQIDGTSRARFRVRVGSFATREAAQQLADRVGREQSLSAFVTSR